MNAFSAGSASTSSAIANGNVQANGIRFACLERGEGPLVLLLHGFPDNAWTYARQLEVFARAGYRAVAPFLRGYAPTEVPGDGRFEPATLGRDLHGLIHALTPTGKAFVVGTDWGGTAVHAALANHPGDVVAAVVMNTAHPATLASVVRDPELIHRLFHFWFFQPPGIERMVAAADLSIVDYLWRIWSSRNSDPEHVRSVKETLSAPGSLAAALSYYRQLYEAVVTGAYRALPIASPTLSLFGGNDPTAKYAHLEEPSFAGAYRRVVLPGVGHFPHLEVPHEVEQSILEWFAAHRRQ
jgi:pimeloyl-ACP methyl ester carboxylesterase